MAFLFKNNKYYELVILTPKLVIPVYRKIINNRSHVSHTLAKKEDYVGKTISSHTKYILPSGELPEEGTINLNEIMFKRKLNCNELENLIGNYLPSEESGIISLVTLKCCSDFNPYMKKERKLKLALSIMKHLKEKNKEVTNEHFEAVLQCFADNDYSLNLDDFLKEVKLLNIKLNDKLYYLILRCLCAKGQMKDVHAIIEDLKKNGIAMQEMHYSELIYGYALLKDWEKVNEILKLMKSSGIKQGNLTYMSLLKAFSKLGYTTQVKEYFALAKSKGIQLSGNQIIQIMEILIYCKKFDFVKEIFSCWLKYEDGYFIKTLMLKLIQENYTEGIFLLIGITYKTDFENCSFFSTYYMKELLYQKQSVDYIASIGETLTKLGLDDTALPNLLFLLCNEGTLEDCTKVILDIKKCGLPLRHHYFWPLIIKAYEVDGEKGMEQVFSLMKDCKIPFCESTLVMVILPRMKINRYTSIHLTKLLDWRHDFISCGILFHYLRKGSLKKALNLSEKIHLNFVYGNKSHILKEVGKLIFKNSEVAGLSNFLKYVKPSIVDGLFNCLLLHPSKFSNQESLFTKILEVLQIYNWEISENLYNELHDKLPENLLTAYNKAILKDIMLKEVNIFEKSFSKTTKYDNFKKIKYLEDELKTEIPYEYRNLIIRKLFHSYLSNEDWEKALSMKILMDDFKIDKLTKVPILWVLVKNRDLAGSRKCFESVINEPDIKISLRIVLDFCSLLAEKGLHKDALSVLKDHKSRFEIFGYPSWNFSQLMDVISKKGDSTLILKYLKELRSILNFTHNFLHPCIKNFIERDEFEEALTFFEQVCSTYKQSPGLVDLIAVASNRKDERALQRIKNASLQIFKKENVIFKHFVAFNDSDELIKVQELIKKNNFNRIWLESKWRESARKGNITELLNFYFALENVQMGEKILKFIVNSFDQSSDFEGAEKFLKILENKRSQIPKNLQPQIINFIDEKLLFQNQSNS